MFHKNIAVLACLAILTACQSSSAKLSETNEHSPLVITIADTGAAKVEGGNAALAPSEADVPEVDATVVGSINKSAGKPSGGKIVIGKYRPPKIGTIFYWKNNWNSLPKRLVHKVASQTATFGGKKAVRMDAIEGTGNGTKTFYDVKTSNLLGHNDKNGNAVVVFPKVEERLRFPMKPGDQWVTSWKSVDRSTQKTTKGGGVVKVIGAEKLLVAGKPLKTMKIQLPLPNNLGRGMKHYIWYSPKFGVVIREQISNGRFVWVKELEKVKLPG